MYAVASAKKIDISRPLEGLKVPALNLTLICVGSIICVIGMNGLLIPFNLLSGGLVGISILFHYLLPFMDIGWIYFFLNIPFAVLGWCTISRRFMAYTLFGMLFFSFAAATIHPEFPQIKDPMLAAIFAGVICGFGGGLILRSIGSAGGMDILAIYLNKRFGFRIGAINFAFNAGILTAGAFLYDIQMLLYSVISLYAGSRVVDAVLTGFNSRKSLMVISDRAGEIADKILADKGRGVTFLKGEGAFTHTEKKVIFTITAMTELSKMKELVFTIDPNAFLVVNDTLEVLGSRHGRGRVY